MAAVTEFHTITMEISGHPLPLVPCINWVHDYVARRENDSMLYPRDHPIGYELLLYHEYMYPNWKPGYTLSPSRIWS